MKCPICESDPIPGRWTDYSGEMNCMNCGIPLQIKWGTDKMKEEGNYPYIQMYPCLAELFKERWSETHKRARFGRWLGYLPEGVTKEQDEFWGWIKENHPEWEPPQSLATRTNENEGK